jgi:hypothetical protein
LRYHLLLRIQAVLTPGHVRGLLGLNRAEWLRPLLRLYPFLVRAGLRSIIQRLIMPSKYLPAVRGLDHRVQRTAPDDRKARANSTPRASPAVGI